MRYINLGRVVLDLPPRPDKQNPRNSEGAFLTKEDGTILFAFSRFRGTDASDHATADIAALISRDDGETFGEERTLLTCEEEGAANIMSVSLLPMKNGDIGLFYLVREHRAKMRMFLRRSADGGYTWGERVLCTPAEGFYVVNNDRVIRLANGNILIPAAHHAQMGAEVSEYAKTEFFCSEDDGRTWRLKSAGGELPSSYGSESGMQEPGILELSPGRIWSWARTDLGKQYEQFSDDNGSTWSPCRPSGFHSPKSPLSMKRDDRGFLYAIWNPYPEDLSKERQDGIFLGGRTPYVMAVSRDNGNTFSEPVAFEWDENSGYCYCAIHFHRDSLLLAYCAGSAGDGSCLVRCRIRKIQLR